MSSQGRPDSIVYIVDDDASMREALSSLVRSVGLRVETCASATDFLNRALADAPQCVILDVRMPGFSGLECQQHLADAGQRLPIIFMTGHGDVRMSVQAMKAGAIDFLLKPFRDQDLLDAVWRAIDRDQQHRDIHRETATFKDRFATLTPREQEVMSWVITGLLNKQIAAELGTSEITVKVHRGHVMNKMKAESVAELVRIASRIGLSPRR